MKTQRRHSGSSGLLWLLLSMVVLSVVSAAGWFVLARSPAYWRSRVQFVVPVLIGAIAMSIISALVLLVEFGRLDRGWRLRVWTEAFESSTPAKGAWARLMGTMPDPLDIIFKPILGLGFARRFQHELANAGLRLSPSRYLLALILATLAGAIVGYRIGGWPLLVTFMVIAHMPLRMFVRSRVRARRTRLSRQVPVALDSLASGLAAGLSIQQALAFAAEEVPEPLGWYLSRGYRRCRLGHSIDWVLGNLMDEQGDEGLRLALDGLQLIHQIGGNAVEMLEETADLVRERVELELEVQSTLAQGRLSAWVVGGLAPVSAGFLLTTNPRYIDVLFETLMGQVLLATAILLQLVGWYVISRLTAFEV